MGRFFCQISAEIGRLPGLASVPERGLNHRMDSAPRARRIRRRFVVRIVRGFRLVEPRVTLCAGFKGFAFFRDGSERQGVGRCAQESLGSDPVKTDDEFPLKFSIRQAAELR